ncbi:MAG TPA: DUF2652 domain-containing protein [Chitinophagaceae bacterium]|nr:DUF2652 domain-containing protein [Chitinophagaceae bacterium]
MENRGLLFIPDISGFTRFVTETEINHSRLIIQELLELLINANEINLEVSEIEGDAILFYRYGESPDLREVYRQVEKMFCEFHKHIGFYEISRFCQCKACLSAVKLTLKIITHYGEFAGYNVKNFSKLIGKDVIVAHQLLKNDIGQHEYWLVTDELLQHHEPAGLANWMQWNNSAKKTETGEISFHYTPLTPLKQSITPEVPLQLELAEKVKMISLSRDYPVHIIRLFHATGDFNYRSRWQEGVRTVEEINHFLPRLGMKCRVVKEGGQSVITHSSYSFTPEKIVFSETDEKKKQATYYTLERINDKTTRLTLDYYIQKNLIDETMFELFRKRSITNELKKSMENLEQVAKEINVSTEY